MLSQTIAWFKQWNKIFSISRFSLDLPCRNKLWQKVVSDQRLRSYEYPKPVFLTIAALKSQYCDLQTAEPVVSTRAYFAVPFRLKAG